MNTRQSLFENVGKLILRLACGGILIPHGLHKIFVEIDHVKRLVEAAGLPAGLAYANLLGELIGPVMVLVGWKTRWGALLIAVNMLASVLIAHGDIVFRLNDFGGWMIETNMLYMTMAIAIFFIGPGRYAIDSR